MENTTDTCPPAGTQPLGGGDVHVSAKCSDNSAPAGTLLERFDRSRLVTVLIFAIVAIGFFWMVNHTPLFSDDYLYRIIFGSNDGKIISSLSDLWASCYAHYMEMNGRFANAPLCMLLEWIGKPTTDFITTGLFLILGFLCTAIVEPEKKSNLMLVAVFGSLFLFADSFSDSFLWLCGSANYLWAIVFGLGFIFAFQKINDGQHFPITGTFFLILLAFFAGWMHEGFSLGICASILVFHFINRKKLSAINIIYSFAFFAGTAMVVFSPGIISRGENTAGMFSPLQQVLKIAKGFIQLPISTPLLTLLIIAVVVCFFRNRERVKSFVRNNLFLSLSILFSIPIPLVFTAYGRGTTFVFVLAMIGVFLFFKKELSSNRARFAVASILGCISVAVFISVAPELKRNSDLHKTFLARYAESTTGVVPLDLSNAPMSGRYLSTAFPSNWTRLKACYQKPVAQILPPNVYENLYLKENFLLPENEVFKGWYSCAGFNFLVRKKTEGATTQDFVGYRYQIDEGKLTTYGRLAAWGLGKLNIFRQSGTLSLGGNVHTGGATITEWEFPSGTYFAMPKSTICFKLPLTVVGIEEKQNIVEGQQ